MGISPRLFIRDDVRRRDLVVGMVGPGVEFVIQVAGTEPGDLVA